MFIKHVFPNYKGHDGLCRYVTKREIKVDAGASGFRVPTGDGGNDILNDDRNDGWVDDRDEKRFCGRR